MNLFLIGYRGTGKSTVGRVVAEQLGWPFVDADDEIECRAGKSIARIFASDGETAFRDCESAVVAELASREQHVIAFGGGAVMRQTNRQAIHGHGTTVWLTADLATIHERIRADEATAERRPALTAAGGLDEIRELLAQRAPVYCECADFEIATDTKTPRQVADEIIRIFAPEPRTPV